MDNIVKIAIIVGIIIIGITGIFVYFKIKKINEEDTYEEIELDDKDSIKLDLLNDSSTTFLKENNLDEKDNTSDKIIDSVKEDIKQDKIPTIKVKEEVINNKIIPESKIESEIDNKVVSNTNNSTINKPYSNKYSTASVLISPVGYYSNELVRNDLMGKRASKVEKPINTDSIENDKEKVAPDTIKIPEVKNDVKEEVKQTDNGKRISFSDMKETYVKKENKHSNFMEEVSEKLSKEIKPQTIELTDYEQKQEDEAIISYQELLASKDKTFNISDDEEDEDFILALKSFRENL